MTAQEIIEAVQGLGEGRIKKLPLDRWLEIELARIINHKHYWWRKKYFTLNTVAATPTYDLTAGATPPAADFHKGIVVYRWLSVTEQVKVEFEGDNLKILRMVYDTTQGTPTTYAVEPGTTKTLRFSPIPVSAEQMVGMYWAGLNPNWASPGVTIPLIPPDFHYVPLLALTKRAFFYLYGQKDARYIDAAEDLKRGLAELDSYKAPSTEHAVEWRSADEKAFVQSTS